MKRSCDNQHEEIVINEGYEGGKRGKRWREVFERHTSHLRPLLGFLLIFICSSCFVTTSAGVKVIEDVDPFSISATRFLTCFLGSLPVLLYSKLPFFPKGYRLKLIVRATVGTTGNLIVFYALKHMPVGDVSMVTASSPVFTVFTAWLILGERWAWMDLLHVAMVLTGIVLMTQPPLIFGSNELYDNDSQYGLAASLLAMAAVLNSLVFVSLRMLKDLHWAVILSFFGLFGFCLSSATSLVVEGPEFALLKASPTSLMGVLAIGLLSLLVQITLTLATKFENASVVSMMRKAFDVSLSFAVQFVFFMQFPNLLGAFGIGLVLLVMVSSGFNKMRDRLGDKNKLRIVYEKLCCI